MSDTEIVVNNMSFTNDDLHSMKPNSEDFTDFDYTKVDPNNCL